MRFIIFLFLFASNSLFAQNKIVGYVKLQSSGKTPLANVEVSALGAQTTFTNEKGIFELYFDKKKVGDIIAIIEFSLEGYRILNEEKCEGITLSSNPENLPLMVVMSKAKEYKTQKAAYYKIIINNAENNFTEERKQLQAQVQLLTKQIDRNVDNVALEKERSILLSEITKLEKEKDQILARAEKLAEQFATIDLDGASQMAKNALDLFKQNKVKAAIALMDDEALDKNMQDAKKAKLNHQIALIKADSAIQQGVENYMIKARLLKVDLKWRGVYHNYLKAIEGDSTNVNNLWETANFMGKLNNQKRAIKYYSQALRYTKNEISKGALLNNLGVQYKLNNQINKAEIAYLNALEIHQQLAKYDPKRFESDVASTLNNLGSFYSDLNQYDKAEEAFLSALEIRKYLAKNNPDQFEPDLAMIHNNLGALYRSLNQLDKAENAYLNALKLFQHLAKNDPDRFEPDLAHIQNNLGVHYYDLNKYYKAENAFLIALEIREHLTKINPQQFETNLAETLNNLGILYTLLKKFDSAENAYLSALEIRKRLAKNNPDRFEPILANTQTNFGGFYFYFNQFEKSNSMLTKSIKTLRKLSKSSPQKFELKLARALIFKANVQMELNNMELAKNHLQEAKVLVEKYPQVPFAQTLLLAIKTPLAKNSFLKKD